MTKIFEFLHLIFAHPRVIYHARTLNINSYSNIRSNSYVEMVRQLLHNKHVSLSGRQSPELPTISERTGIPSLTRPQEKQLHEYYLNNPDLDVSYYKPKTPQLNEADLSVLTKFSHYYNSEFNQWFNPIEQWYWTRMALDYSKDNDQINMQFMKNMAFECKYKRDLFVIHVNVLIMRFV